MFSVFSHLLAALLPLAIGAVARWVFKRRAGRALRREFWNRQGRAPLERIGVLAADEVPEPLTVLADHWAATRTANLLAVASDIGLFEFIEANPNSSAPEISQRFGWAPRVA